MTERKLLPVANASRLAFLAAQIAIEAPMGHNDYTPRTAVRWPLIEEIRAELESVGVDWRKAVREVRRTERELREVEAMARKALTS